MPYIDRDEDNNIIGISNLKRNSEHKFLPDDDPGLMQHLSEKKAIIEEKQVRLEEIQIEQKLSGMKTDTVNIVKDKINDVYQPVIDAIADIKTSEKTNSEKINGLIDIVKSFIEKNKIVEKKISIENLR